MRRVKLPIRLVCATLVTAAVAAESGSLIGTAQAVGRQALLVGATAYEHLDPRWKLLGPANDVLLMKETLLARGFSEGHIVVLSDGPGADGRPTRSAILREIDRLAESARGDDIVVLHFAGHGSQQPDGEDDDGELDGLDEIFLPTDVKTWIGQRGSVENAIVDDEIARGVAKIAENGAFVWLVVDSCFSGTFVRGAPVEERDRMIPPEHLGVPPAALEQAKTTAPGFRGAVGEAGLLHVERELGENGGGFVPFYASQTTQVTPELRLPLEVPRSEQNWYGLFSFNVASVLARAVFD